MVIAYKQTEGFAHDARCVPDNYQPQPGERTLPGWDLPAIDSLHDPAAVAAKAARDALRAKIVALEAPTGFTRKQREWLIDNTDGKLRDALAAVEAAIEPERAKLRK